MRDRWSHIATLAVQERSQEPKAATLPARHLVERLLLRRDFDVALQAGAHPMLRGGWAAIYPDAGIAYCDRDLSPERQAFALAHELGHILLHAQSGHCAAELLDPEARPTDALNGSLEVYNPLQQRELEANVFAVQLLAPRSLLYQLFVRQRLSARAIAGRLGVSSAMVLNALTGLLLPERPREEGEQSGALTLDPSQRAAATSREGAAVHAGPGTGKTHTLVGRVVYLVHERGVDPRQVLVLTYTNRAAAELRARCRAALGEQAGLLTISTIHAFAHEVLRRYSAQAGLPPDFPVFDPPAMLVLLRAHLTDFCTMLGDLESLVPLDAPLPFLSRLCEVVGRAREDRVDAAAFAERLAALPPSETGTLQATFYRWYEQVLAGRQGVDLAGLLLSAERLLRERPAIRAEVRSRSTQVLIDEYQDVNQATAALLWQIAPDTGIWAVGDTAQAIYRWRGAAPEAIWSQAAESPGALPLLSLARNYRSNGPITRLCSRAADALDGPDGQQLRLRWESSRGEASPDQKPVVYAVADDEEAEIDGIASLVREGMAAGLMASDHAILCGTNAQADALAAALRARGIEANRYAGAEHDPAVRQALALLAVVQDNAEALLRLAYPHGVPARADRDTPRATQAALPSPLFDPDTAWALLRRARTRERRAFFDTLRHPPAGMSKAQATAVRRLATFVRQHRPESSASRALARYLFDTPYAAARELLAARHAEQCAALAALLTGARAYDRLPPDQRLPGFPQHLALLLDAGEGMPAERVESQDGVHVLTVHAAKGQEWPVVFVPYLAKHRFPGHRRNGEPVAAGILNTDNAAAREQDDQCLFFVAISRARDRLVLSRALRYGNRDAEPSPLLALLESGFAAEPPIRLTWQNGPAPAGDAPIRTGSVGVPPAPPDAATTFPPSSTASASANGQMEPSSTTDQPTQEATLLPDIDLHDLETYLQCPQRYAYEHELGLERVAWPARHFHTAIRRALGNLQGGVPYTNAEVEAVLQEAWVAPHEPLPYEPLYLARARRAITDVVGRQAERAATPTSMATEHNVPFQLTRPHGIVRGRIDRLDHDQDTSRRAIVYRTGKQQDQHRRDLRTALAQAALDSLHGGGTVRQEYVLTGAIDDKVGRAKTLADRLAEADAALQGIAAGRFVPKPGRICPSCPFWLLCPGVGDQEPGEE